MKLSELLKELPRYRLEGGSEADVRAITLDSRRIGGGGLFVCLEGLARNGHDFAATAVAQGATALLVRYPVPEAAGVPQIVVEDPREAMARLAAAFHGHPSRDLRVIGVTGTNGKTTVTHLLEAIAHTGGIPVEVLGTLGSRVGGAYRSTGFTTPESPELQGLFREAVDRGTRWVAMEVSSHALAQKRVFATDFAAAVFTNLTRDHLDYHETMEAYFEAKARLFSAAGTGSTHEPAAVIPADDPHGRLLAERAAGTVTTYGLDEGAAVRARDVRHDAAGTSYVLVASGAEHPVRLPLLGDFNVRNALAAQGAALALGIPLDVVARGVGAVDRVRGRMEPVSGSQPFTVLVDYAHTPDALEHALQAARAFTRGRLHVVFGCGGDRDRGKRPEMGAIAARLADRVVVTSDNPRSEDPERILDEILAGIPRNGTPVLREVDRERAIHRALEVAGDGDTVLVAGKGHETYQIFRDRTVPFDDRAVVARALRGLGFDADDPD
jgi:UDP-N-acetylmuramoyl-L-alanyl-D-glutamate--2,6-diaminopimelate ligase